jgi:hypothetical protein
LASKAKPRHQVLLVVLLHSCFTATDIIKVNEMNIEMSTAAEMVRPNC